MQITDNELPEALISEITSQCSRAVPAETAILTDALQSRYGESLQAILLYGSCLRSQHLTEGVVDLYAIVDSYKNAYQKLHLRYMNALLPPNVFYIEVQFKEKMIRAKYAVISLTDLNRGCSEWFHSYLWSRFAQPLRLLYARDAITRGTVHIALTDAVLKFLRSTIPVLLPGTVDTEAIWVNGLTLTYAAELRPEQQVTRARHITDQNLGDLSRLTIAAAPALAELILPLANGYYRVLAGQHTRDRSIWQWRLRRWQGRVLSVLRLTKAVFTFANSVDYAAWKIQRHTGVTITVSPRLRRHPVLFGFSVLWRLLRQGTIR